MVTKEGYTKMNNFTIPEADVLMLDHDHTNRMAKLFYFVESLVLYLVKHQTK